MKEMEFWNPKTARFEQAASLEVHLAKVSPVEVMALGVSPERQLEQAVPNAIRDLIELTQNADSERVQLDAIKALLMLAGVGKREAEIEANDINGDETRATIMRLLQEKSQGENL